MIKEEATVLLEGGKEENYSVEEVEEDENVADRNLDKVITAMLVLMKMIVSKTIVMSDHDHVDRHE